MTEAPLHPQALEAYVGRTLEGRYRIDALIGQGGMGAVFRARHAGLDTDVAVKILLPHAGGAAAPARFRREAKSASRLDHPGCVRVTDFGELEGGAKYLVMELVVGVELKARLGTPWDPRAAIDVASQVLAALAHAHGRGVVHRDLKPENVLLCSDDDGRTVAKIVDFGIAKILEGDEGDARLTRTGMRFGTPRYMSPEQAGGGKVDERTDLYAVGLLLYEMLAGHPPFVTDDAAVLVRMQVLTPPPPLPAAVPPSIVAIVMRLLAKSRTQRFASARDTLAALQASRAELEGATIPPIGAAGTNPGIPTGTTPKPAQPAHFDDPATAVEGAWSAPRRRPSSTRLALLVFAGIVILGSGIAAILANTANTANTAGTAGPAGTPSRAPSPVSMPTPVPAFQPSAPTCTDDCELRCDGSRECALSCGEDCSIECEGSSRCTLDVGEGSDVECGGKAGCDVICRGACEVECKGKAECAVQCASEAAPGPSRCDKHTLACGECP